MIAKPDKQATDHIRLIGGISEDTVKRRFVPFLKEFYRNRYEPSPDTIKVNLDNVGTGGIVADGMITFKKEDDSTFVCTYEATSRDKIEEVRFSLNLVYFLWDCAAFGALCAACSYGFFYVTQFKWLYDLQATGNIGLIIGTATMGFFAWYFTMQGWRKYRYIYAIEQFKRYQADEQWVALAEDVFPAPNDPYMVELKTQCIYQGFGLALVPAEGPVRILNAPSRIGIFGKDRKMVDWFTRSQWYKTISQNVTTAARYRPPDTFNVYWNKVARPVRHLVIEPFKKHIWGILSKPFGQTTDVYSRFMGGQKVQKWVFALSLATLLPLCYQVLSFSEENLADLEELKHWESDINPEDQPGYTPNDDILPQGVPKQYPVPVQSPEPEITTINLSGSDDEIQTINLSGDDEDDVPTINLSGDEEEPSPPPQPARAASKAGTASGGPCAGVKGRTGWIIQDNAYSSGDNALARVNTLKANDISATATPRSCFESGGSGYIVWLGAVRPTREAAQKTADDLGKTLRRLGLGKAKLMVRELK
ncbi:MAG: SPOR domain-containing protein [Lewinellaceae bacterium]|nr:SPOR domain-containing protein [Lewinellaceae bacterium]